MNDTHQHPPAPYPQHYPDPSHGPHPGYPQYAQQQAFYPPPYPPPGWQPQAPIRRNNRSRMTAALLAFFLGWVGVHKFYLGKIDHGVVYLIFSFTMIPLLISFIEFIVLLTKTDEQFDRQYNY